jgi:hypothetical protein
LKTFGEIRIEKESKIENHNLDFYSGDEKISFNNRHPIYRTLMKLEFEKAIRNYLKDVS